MKRLTALLKTLALMALMALPAFAQGDNDFIEITLEEQNDSGISGTATLEGYGDGTTEVTLLLEGVDPEGAYPAHIHACQCPEPGEITYPLEPVVPNSGGEPGFEGGYSFTVLDVPLDEILAQQSAINVHLYSDLSVYVACGDLPMAAGTPLFLTTSKAAGARTPAPATISRTPVQVPSRPRTTSKAAVRAASRGAWSPHRAI